MSDHEKVEAELHVTGTATLTFEAAAEATVVTAPMIEHEPSNRGPGLVSETFIEDGVPIVCTYIGDNRFAPFAIEVGEYPLTAKGQTATRLVGHGHPRHGAGNAWRGRAGLVVEPSHDEARSR